MHQPSPIRYLKNEEIDRNLWDECIKASPYALIYARSIYLDNMCPGWCALAEESYGWVVPLTRNTKWGISYLYQPAFTQQLGIFAKPGIAIPYPEIFKSLQRSASFWEVNWNYGTAKNFIPSSVKISEATNYILSLCSSYTQIANGYHNDLKRNILVSRRFQHSYAPSDNYRDSIARYKTYYGARLPGVKTTDYQRFEQLCQYLVAARMVICREVRHNTNEVLASALLLRDDYRIYNIMNTTTEAGRKFKANHFLLDCIIREFSGTGLLFDFEGSDLPGVRSFYRNFGATNQPFFQIKFNNLSWPLNVLKR